MDKDFIKIDDLVKLRLSGVEETERSGSWLSMRELLDKEMPQDRTGGIIYWRRTFSVVAALSLLATIGIGGYELSSSFRNHYTDGNVVIADAPGAAPEKSSEVSNIYQLQEASAEKKREIAAHIANATNGVKDEKTATQQMHQHKYAAGNTLHHTSSSKKASHNVAAENTAGNATAAMNTVVTSKVATGSQSATEHKNVPAHKHNTHVAANVEHTANNTVASGSTAVPTIPATANGEQPKHEHGAGRKDAGAKTAAVKTTHTTNHKGEAAATTHEIAANKNNHTNNKNTEENKGTKTTNKSIDKLVLGSAASIATGTHTAAAITEKKVDVSAVTKDAAKTNATSKADNKPAMGASTAANKTATGSEDKTAAPNSAITGASVQKLTASASKVSVPKPDDPALRSLSVMNMSKGKKVIERMILHEHFIKTSPSEGYFKLDTISVETVTTELGLNNNNTTQHVMVKKQGTNAVSPVAGKPGEMAGGEEGATDANGNIIPAATANSQTGVGLKAAAAADKSSGSKVVQKLNAAFNDIKYKFGSPKFQPGVTAGINNTFFGPHSFKGFQFGVTGNVMFNDQWAILGELKYFHRINGNASIEDDYNTYTPTANGQFSKQQQLNSYSFSALHSLEMPISIRYCMGNFNFFAGGNLVYTFSINTGAETMPSTATPTIVSAPGNDNAPQLKEEDFRSRIGLGYLLGLSYNIAPSTMLDLRSVQTVWDNANTPGAKMISTQLYKSPSLQLSIIYRLGGNRARD